MASAQENELIVRLRTAEAASHDALEAARANCDSLTRELAGLRRAIAAREAGLSAIEREENAILRQNINEIGAAIIRMANGGIGLAREQAAPQNELQDVRTQDERIDPFLDDAQDRHGRVLAKAGGGGASK